MATLTASSLVAVLLLSYISLQPGLNAASIPDSKLPGGVEPLDIDHGTEEEELPMTAEPASTTVEDSKTKFNVSEGIMDFDFLRDEIDKHRIITTDINGNERVSSDEEVL